MTADESFEIALKYYTGDGMPKNRSLAAEYFKQAAILGHVSAQYNLGLLYKLGDGVEADYLTSRNWFEKAAANGHENALRQLVSLKFMLIRSYMQFGSSGFDSARETANEILSDINRLSSLTEEDRFNQREAYRILGLVSAAGNFKDLPSLLAAKEYYEKGLPISEGNNIDAMVSYTIVFDNLGDITGDNSYYAKAYNAALDIYHNAFDRLRDPDDKALILSFLVLEGITGRNHPVDLDMAEKLNNIIGTLGSSNAAMYEHYKQAIAQKRYESRPYVPDYTPYTSSSSSSSKIGDKVKGVLGKLFH